MINLCPSIFIGMDSIHSTGLGTWSFLFDNGIIWTGFHTFAAFDTFFLIDYRPAILHMNGILGTDLLTWVLQAALTAFCHQDSFLRAGIAGKFDNINKRRLIIFLLNKARLHPFGNRGMLGNVAQGQSHCHTQPLSYNGSFQENTVTVCGNFSWQDLVWKLVHFLLNIALVGKTGDFSKNLVSDLGL